MLQRQQWIGRDRSHRTACDISGFGLAATCHRRCHTDRRFLVSIEFSEFFEQSSSRYKPTDKHTEHSEFTCRSGNHEIRTKEDDERFQDEGDFPRMLDIL